MVDRLLLLREILPDRAEGFRVLGELTGERARVGLGSCRQPAERRDLRSDAVERPLEFLDPGGEPALNGGQPVAGRADRPVDRRAGLAKIVDDQRQLVAQPVARAGESLDRIFGAEGTASRKARWTLHVLGQALQQGVDRLARMLGRVGGDVRNASLEFGDFCAQLPGQRA